MSTSSLFRSVFFNSVRFAGSSGGETGVAGRFGDFIITRFFTDILSCVSVRFSPLPELGTSGLSLVSSGSPCISSSSSGSAVGFFLLIFGYFWWSMRKSERFSCRWGVRCRRPRLLWCFDSCSRHDASRKNKSLISSGRVLDCEVAFAQPHGGFPSVGKLRRGIPRSFSHLWKASKHRFTDFQQLSTMRTTQGSTEWGVYIVSPKLHVEQSISSVHCK